VPVGSCIPPSVYHPRTGRAPSRLIQFPQIRARSSATDWLLTTRQELFPFRCQCGHAMSQTRDLHWPNRKSPPAKHDISPLPSLERRHEAKLAWLMLGAPKRHHHGGATRNTFTGLLTYDKDRILYDDNNQ
jgi:hypothetical protein